VTENKMILGGEWNTFWPSGEKSEKSRFGLLVDIKIRAL
jgi:hypothetical protein